MVDTLSEFEVRTHHHDGRSYEVYVAGDGPAVLVLPEIPGITPDVADYARRTIEAGFTVWVPSFFGTPGKPMTYPYAMRELSKACVNRTFLAFARGKRAPIIDWLRDLAATAHEQCGGPGVGVVGMCFTGNFALALAVDDVVKLPVMSQPSLPMGPLPSSRRDLHVAPDDLAAIKQRTVDDELCVIGLRFSNDPLVPSDRFRRLEQEFGRAFIGVEIDSSKGNEHGFDWQSHSVLTAEYSPDAGHPTNDAFQLVTEHLQQRLLG